MDVDEDPYAPVVKVVTVPSDAGTAFAAFTTDLEKWWPFDEHSVGEVARGRVTFGTAAGEPVTEHLMGGSPETWGTLTRWEPPAVFVMTWHPARPPAMATELEVRFTETADGTRVQLRHTGWEHRQDGGTARRAYDTGWDMVLGHYVAHTTG
ncbi:SRPBCC domain-containing protein [Georgenia subflava]|uniref:Activator of Hsp90 ATPase homologue 1/2-like C-terminal domain-containing protein n=1 Tax=Georgenia subflava TaxID=1622177 RepID=A0A6N7EJ03_9MICO|nr:SRPBCC domain-containing protein [Georgenia subflava]MPV36166.1 hypothetical protein [Georgenia subflava]